MDKDDCLIDVEKRSTVHINLNRNGILYEFPGKAVNAKAHSKTFRIGEIQNNYERKCECCGNSIPWTEYTIRHHIKNFEFMKYGIDIVNFFEFVQNYFICIAYWALTYVIQMLICLFFFNIPSGIQFDILYLDIYYQIIVYSTSVEKFYIDYFFTFLRISIILYAYFKNTRKIKRLGKKYQKRLSDEIYIDESVFSVIIKNLPKVVEKNDLIKFLNEHYHVDPTHIRDVILLKDFSKIAMEYDKLLSLQDSRKKMESMSSHVKYKISDMESFDNSIDHMITKLMIMIKEYEANPLLCGTGIVIFEDLNEKNSLLRMYVHVRGLSHMYHGKRMVIENAPMIEQIDWSNIRGSNAEWSKNWLKVVFAFGMYFICSLVLFSVVYLICRKSSLVVFSFDIFSITMIKPLVLMVINLLMEVVIPVYLSMYSLSDKYFKTILHTNLVMQKTYLNTIFILSIVYFIIPAGPVTTLQYLDVFYFILLFSFYAIITTRFSLEYIWNHIIYYAKTWPLQKKMIQKDINELYRDNGFNIFKTFEKHRIMVYSVLMLLKVYPCCGIIMCVVVCIHFFVIRWSLFHSEYKERNYFGYYFNIMAKVELSTLLIIVISSSLTSIISETTIVFIFFTLMEINNILQFFYFHSHCKSKYTITKNYTQVEHKLMKRFNDYKFLDMEGLKRELCAARKVSFE